MDVIKRFPEWIGGLALVSAAVALLRLEDGEPAGDVLQLADDGDGGPARLGRQQRAARLPPPRDGDGVVTVGAALQLHLAPAVRRHHAVAGHREPRGRCGNSGHGVSESGAGAVAYR